MAGNAAVVIRRYESKDHGFVRMLFHKSLLENWIPAYRFVFMTKSPRWSPLPHNRRVFNCVAFATTTKYEVAESRSWLSQGEFPPPWPHQHRLPFLLLLSPSLPAFLALELITHVTFFFPPLSGSGSTWNRAWRMRIWSSGPAVEKVKAGSSLPRLLANLLALLHIKPRCKPKTREKGEKTLDKKHFQKYKTALRVVELFGDWL